MRTGQLRRRNNLFLRGIWPAVQNIFIDRTRKEVDPVERHRFGSARTATYSPGHLPVNQDFAEEIS